jgi:predicted amidophosphoribosyltransferase
VKSVPVSSLPPPTHHLPPFPVRTISAHKYVSPRSRTLTPEEAEVRRIAYALKITTAEACSVAARDLAPLLDAAEAPDTHLVLMPVPASTGSIDANRQFANELAAEVHRRYPARRVQIKITVGRQHPVESSCVRRRRGEAGLSIDQHAFIRVAGPLTATGTAYYFIDNMATTGRTLAACRAALGFGDGIVWADEGMRPRPE